MRPTIVFFCEFMLDDFKLYAWRFIIISHFRSATHHKIELCILFLWTQNLCLNTNKASTCPGFDSNPRVFTRRKHRISAERGRRYELLLHLCVHHPGLVFKQPSFELMAGWTRFVWCITDLLNNGLECAKYKGRSYHWMCFGLGFSRPLTTVIFKSYSWWNIGHEY